MKGGWARLSMSLIFFIFANGLDSVSVVGEFLKCIKCYLRTHEGVECFQMMLKFYFWAR